MNGGQQRKLFTTCTGIALSIAACWPLVGVGAAQAGAAAPPAPTESRAHRQQAAIGVVSALAMRVDAAGKAVPGVRVADYLKRAGTERSLSAESLAELLSLLRSESGFDDSVRKRCRPGTSVGFVLTGTSANAAEETELALDFGCNKLILTRAGSNADAHATDFGPSRSAFVALVQRALPHDRELRKLR